MNSNDRIDRVFTRPGYSTITAFGTLEEAYAIAREAWKKEGEEKAAALEITADEYARLARKGLVAAHIEANAKAFDARPDTQDFAGRNHAAALYRTAAKAHRDATK